MSKSAIFLKAPAYYPFISCKRNFSSQLVDLDMQYLLTLTLNLGLQLCAVRELTMQWVFTMGQAHLPFSVLQQAGQRWKSEAGCGGQCFYLIGYDTSPLV